ncbi:protein O-mannosyl-transferase 2-like [Ptychodera flava]|uniref:protein O-mannosyl-transferase 2-like n=1 Tax=Ptychodera flava TaxID=63121 RepID=UPI00396A1C4A
MVCLCPCHCTCLRHTLYKIEEPDHVCWDETHFGKMGSYYINRTFFFDVHPPLGKMLIGLSGLLTGYNGSFEFENPGVKYGDINYVGMRTFCAILGSLIVPLSYLTVFEFYNSVTAAFLTSLLIIFDTGFLTLSQYILLDPILIFFITIATYCLAKFDKIQDKPFTKWWWFWLTMTGVFLACAFSVKWVGLFVILLVGLKTVFDLWQLLGDLSLSKTILLHHFLARALCLIMTPALIYMGFFAVHFKVLAFSGSGDGFFSSAFQSTLIGNSLYKASMPQDLVYGSIITLKNQRPAGGLLHSHWHLYPEGSGAMQQQITAYTHKDENNKWIIKRFDRDPEKGDMQKPVEYVKNGDFIRLEHLVTRRNLHSHREPAPLTPRHQQVTGYGEDGIGDVNDIWKIEIIDGPDNVYIKTVRTTVRLIHYVTGCALHSHSKTLPKWGWEQLEVTCNPHIRDKKNLWNVEDHINERLPNSSFEVFAPSFLESFLESHAVMAQSNSGLKPKEGEVTSRPWQWPVNYKGQRFSGVNETDYRVYLLGNPIIWWSNLAAIGVFCTLAFVFAVMAQRGIEGTGKYEELKKKFLYSCTWFLIGWALHYFPFYLMGRVLYFHHYFPAMVYSNMLTGVLLDYALSGLHSYKLPYCNINMYMAGNAVIVAVIIQSFALFYPLSYGMHGELAENVNSTMSGLKWMESWEI